MIDILRPRRGSVVDKTMKIRTRIRARRKKKEELKIKGERMCDLELPEERFFGGSGTSVLLRVFGGFPLRRRTNVGTLQSERPPR